MFTTLPVFRLPMACAPMWALLMSQWMSMEHSWAQTFNVTFRVDMNNEMVAAEGVHLAGNFQGWDPAATMMADDDMDGVYELTVDISDTLTFIEYKFINGNAWGADEAAPAPCAWNGGSNRYAEISGATELDVVCFGQCAACGITTVMFKIDMSQEEAINPVGVHMNGNFNGWDGSNFLMMDDSDGDLIHTYVAQIDGAALEPVNTVHFVFVNGNAWGFNENPDGECASQGNRFLELTGGDVVYEINGQAYCYNTCGSCVAPTPVTFRVDMSTQAAVSANGVCVAGNFQGWTPGVDFLYDDDGDLVFEATIDVQPGDYEFRFINGNSWGGDGDGNIDNENPPGACTLDGNRTLSVGSEPIVVEYCYNECEANCDDAFVPADITFRVDMSEQVVSPNGVFMSGTFDGWCGTCTEMLDPDGDDVYTVTIPDVEPGVFEWKFLNGGWGAEEIFDPAIDGECTLTTGYFTNRFLVVNGDTPSELEAFCFNSCDACNNVMVELALDAADWMEENGFVSLTITGDWPGASESAVEGTTSFYSTDEWPIPDDQTQCFSHAIEVAGYPDGAVISESLMLNGVSVNMEHSFMGDLTITLICPSGGSIGLHQQGGGGTYLGVPVDVDSQPNDPGVGYDYYWSPDATNGTWSDNAGGTLFSGTYEAAQPWTLLEGCPLNGTWTIEVCDSWGSDNGFIFGWGLDFNQPSMVPQFIMELDPVDGIHKLNIQLSDDDALAGFGFDVHAWDGPFSEESFHPELPDLTCGDGGWSRFFLPPDGWLGEDGDTIQYVHGPSGLVHCAGECFPCEWPGCMDPVADNYNSEATTDDGTCIYPISCADIGDASWGSLEMGVYPSEELTFVMGTEVWQELVLNVPSQITEPGTGQLYSILEAEMVSVQGLPLGLQVELVEGLLPAGSQACLELTGIPFEADSFEVEWAVGVVLNLFGSPFPIGEITVSSAMVVVPNPDPILGCIYPGATNYLPFASVDDGSCIIEGCLDPLAVNYHPAFNTEDGSCLYPEDFEETNCQPDINDDTLVGVADLLILLGEFGNTCPE